MHIMEERADVKRFVVVQVCRRLAQKWHFSDHSCSVVEIRCIRFRNIAHYRELGEYIEKLWCDFFRRLSFFSKKINQNLIYAQG